jgi:hypothetical protein
MANPERDLAAKIASALGLVVGTGVFYGRVQPPEDGIPARAVFVIPIGGPKPDNYVNGGAARVRRYSDLQVRVRADLDDVDGGHVFTRQVRDAVHHAVIAGYLEVECLASEATPLGPDQRGYPEWSVTVRMTANN